MNNKLIVKRYIFEPIKSNMYILTMENSNEAIVIDPHISDKAWSYLRNKSILKVKILLTHEHFDHTSGVNKMKHDFNGTLTCTTNCAARITQMRNNRPLIIASMLLNQMEDEKIKQFVREFKPYECVADQTFQERLDFFIAGHKFSMIATPGHSCGSCCIEVDDQYVFTGDSLIINTPVITRFSTGSSEDYQNITMQYLKHLSHEITVLPGHGDFFKLGSFVDY